SSFRPRRSARSPRPPSAAPNATARRHNGRRSRVAPAANSTPSATGTGRSRAGPPTFERGEAVIVVAIISQASLLNIVPGMQHDAAHEVLAMFQHGVRFGGLGERQHRVDRYADAPFLQKLRDHALIVTRCPANAGVLSSLLTMSTTRNGISHNSPPTGQNVPPRRKASMHSRMSSLAPVYSTAASTPSPPVAARIALTASSRPLSTTISAPQRSSLAALPGWRGGDDGGAGELGKCNGGRAHAAGGAGNENAVVHPHVKSVGDDAVGGGARTHGGGALIEVEIGPHFDPVALGSRDELRVAAEHGVAGKIDPAGKIAEPANACERERVFGIGHAEHAVAGCERRHAGAHRRDLAGDVAAELHRHVEGAAAVDAAVMSGGLAVELLHLAGAVFHVPAPTRGGR